MYAHAHEHGTLYNLVGDVLRHDGRPSPHDRVGVPLEEVEHLAALDAGRQGLPHALSRDGPHDGVRQQGAQLEEEAEHGEVELRPRVGDHLWGQKGGGGVLIFGMPSLLDH